MKPIPHQTTDKLSIPRILLQVVLICSFCHTSKAAADIVHDFSVNPLTWTTSAGPLTWDSDGDLVDDFQVSMVTGFVDSVSGLFVIDNLSTANGGIEKIFVFSISSMIPLTPDTEVALLGFDFFSEKNVEVGGSGGAGSILADVFDDVGAELVNGINISGSLGSNPSRVDIPGTSRSLSFTLTVDLDSPPNNDDAQVIIGDIVFNGGTVRAFNAIPEPSGGWLLLGVGCTIWGLRRRR